MPAQNRSLYKYNPALASGTQPTEVFDVKEKTIECKLNKGIYFVKLSDKNRIYTKKIIVQ